jgi:polyhydroxyalkanoate synthesis regulator phasin
MIDLDEIIDKHFPDGTVNLKDDREIVREMMMDYTSIVTETYSRIRIDDYMEIQRLKGELEVNNYDCKSIEGEIKSLRRRIDNLIEAHKESLNNLEKGYFDVLRSKQARIDQIEKFCSDIAMDKDCPESTRDKIIDLLPRKITTFDR